MPVYTIYLHYCNGKFHRRKSIKTVVKGIISQDSYDVNIFLERSDVVLICEVLVKPIIVINLFLTIMNLCKWVKDCLNSGAASFNHNLSILGLESVR